MNKIYMKELILELNYADARPVRAWCKKNKILIIKNGKSEYVYESAFKEVIESPFIEKLKLDFGNEWESAYNLYASGNVLALNTLQKVPEIRYKTYKSNNPVEIKYKNIFKEHAKSKVA